MLTEEVIKKRRGGLGGSDAAAVAGLNRWKTPYQVYLEKLGLAEPQAMNESMYFGHVLEPIIAAEYERRQNKQCAIEPNILIHPKFDWMLANIDRRIVGENAILECKATDNPRDWGEPGTDEIPTSYLLQVAHYAAVCDVERVDIAVLIGLKEFRVYHYYRDESLEIKLMLKEQEFWHENVLKQVPPPAHDYQDALRQWNKDDSSKSSIATEEVEDAYFKLIRRKNLIKKLEAAIDIQKSKIASHMQDASQLFDSKGQLIATWKFQEKKGYQVKPSSTRVFKLKEI